MQAQILNRYLLVFWCVIFWGGAHKALAQKTAFIENKGQWVEDFDYKLPVGYGGVFLKSSSVTVNLVRPVSDKSKQSGHAHQPMYSGSESYAYRMTFLGANTEIKANAGLERSEYLNFILGNDPERWKGKVHLFEQVRYKSLYPNIDVLYYFSTDQNLKYDMILKPGAEPDRIKLYYEGQQQLKLVYGNLMVQTSLGDVMESAPYAYQNINGKKVEVPCSYRLWGDTLGFVLGDYNVDEELIIDPTLIFSTYTGSLQDNWGYSATYGADGSGYGGGIVFGLSSGYPTKMAYQAQSGNSAQAGIDIAISKFTPDGTALIYSTYFGGEGKEMPYSLLEGKNGELILLGNTGSRDFPVSGNAFQPKLDSGAAFTYVSPSNSSYTYNYGVDIFVARFSADGSNLLASSYLGGSGPDGVNSNFRYNYGDDFRGDIAEDDLGNIYAVSNTRSSDFPTANSTSAYQGVQDGVVFSLNTDLSQLNWSHYYGGKYADGLLSLKMVNDTMIYVAGASYQTQNLGRSDGWIMGLNNSDGSVRYITYNGTNLRDANFLLDFDAEGNIYAFGQSLGDYPIIGNEVYADTGAHQFLQMFSADLSQSKRSTVFGNPNIVRANLSPTALMVDDCNNVYVSGWGGGSNAQFGGPLSGMPVTTNAFKKNTDTRDFYFMVLDASWKKINYATYFGEQGGLGDHVDGGTSRFKRDGTIFQAVCASCLSTDSFPTTTGSYSETNGSNNCNLALFKFAIESDITIADIRVAKDSGCIPYTTNIQDLSYNSDIVLIQSPNGSTDTLKNATLTINNTGYQTLTFIAIDTTCGLSDTTTHDFFGEVGSLDLAFDAVFDSCVSNPVVQFNNNTINPAQFVWDFGDGGFSQEQAPQHTYNTTGTYTVKLFGTSDLCGVRDTVEKEIVIRDLTDKNEFTVEYTPCETDVLQATFRGQGSGFQVKDWYVNDSLVVSTSRNLFYFKFPAQGRYVIRLESEDTICNRVDTYSEILDVFSKGGDAPYRVPNVFTPNGDGDNDQFSVVSKNPLEVSAFHFKIFNRWGVQLFQTQSDKDGWDGNFDGNQVPQGVYYYLLSFRDECGTPHELKGFFHLFR